MFVRDLPGNSNGTRQRLLGALLTLILYQAAPLMAQAPIDYARDVQPILAQNCYACHGPDAAARQADLRLDQRDSALAESSGGVPAIVPGRPQESELYRRLTSSDPAVRMPPPDAEHQPTLKQIAILKRWIEEGAPWEGLWSLRPLPEPKVPRVKDESWPRNRVDRYVLAALESQNLMPAAPAKGYDWLRRVTFDLTGLPPTPHEISEFVGDDSPDAEKKVIDRLLASDAYGENFARQWLDLARYADTHGYNIDSHREMWRWREWVIEALNANMPFDQFTIEQLAGDLLPGADINQLTATGFHRNHPINDEEGAFPEEYQHAYVVDRVNTTGTVWLGFTLACAQCHDHKYDPVSQEDYYRLAAYFDNIAEQGLDGRYGNAAPVIKSPTRAQQTRLAELERAAAQVSAQLEAKRASAHASLDQWRASAASARPLPQVQNRALVVRESFDRWPLPDGPLDVTVPGGEPILVAGRFEQALLADGRQQLRLRQRDESALAQPLTFSNWIYPTTDRRQALYVRRGVPGQQLLVMQEGARVEIVRQSPGSTAELRVASLPDWETHQWHHLAVTLPPESLAKARLWLNGQEVPLISETPVDPPPADRPPGDEGESDPVWEAGEWLLSGPEPLPGVRGMVDAVRVDAAALPDQEVQVLAGGDPLAELLAIDPALRSPRQSERLLDFMLRDTDPEFVELERRQEELSRQENHLRAQFPETMVMRERDQQTPTHIRLGGQYDRLGPEVSAGVPRQLFDRVPDGPADRLQLARWLVDPQNPLTPRVVVNRIWQHFFGRGLVASVDDFGTRGELPSHPALLDYLAWELVHSGWDVQHVQRLIVDSATYRQTSRVGAEAYQADLHNRHLARGPRLRLSAEEIRDQALAASGLLVRQIGGTSVRPYQPPGLWEEMSKGVNFSAQIYVQDQGARLYRRSLYTYRKRTSPPPNMAAFDAPNREVCVTQRSRTNTPLQALVLLNDVTFVEAARVLAADLYQHYGADTAGAIDEAFLRIVSRPIEPTERNLLEELYLRELARFQEDSLAAQDLLSQGDSPPPQTDQPAQVAALAVVCHTIINLDEAIVTP